MADTFSNEPRQLLKPDAYRSEEWLKTERELLFSKTWSFACMEFDIPEPGDFIALKVGNYPLFVLRDNDGDLRAFHNICRHRGTEVLEGRGNAGKTIVCPYHRWTYMLDGRLRGLPNADHFSNLDKPSLGLKPAATGTFKEMVFINPSPAPELTFEDWLSPLQGAEWPHNISAADLQGGEEFVYRMKCNWKVFYENAIDGYHLAYLHENTLGGPLPDKNAWDIHGLNLVWYSTERDEIRNRVPQFVEKQVESMGGAKVIPGAETPGYGGVYMLFPTTIVTPSKWSLTISTLEPVKPDETILRAKTWVPKSWFDMEGGPKSAPGYSKDTGEITSDNWVKHPLETGDFQTEDIWVCEKMQRSLNSPVYEVGPLAAGSGSEAPIEVFQKQVLEFVR
ncbi:MAG: aromatic ring-hydroxylating dioxygenase subunit alpha [Pseudomonadota bacterium]